MRWKIILTGIISTAPRRGFLLEEDISGIGIFDCFSTGFFLIHFTSLHLTSSGVESIIFDSFFSLLFLVSDQRSAM